ncbi:DUF732 domain-containing protein [Nocardia sp. 2]|uniref:DUF732 domain-containing protein n=1 Tax=Nocardia acididurans TaxID=2802282 RepID=A0ABS1MBD1_9NOCA|nr:DUF732 domain-containing protein [Nocardia acididurans]MBL1077941.1 DUF732 domain-containing protein [Nocardia acididurans]
MFVRRLIAGGLMAGVAVLGSGTVAYAAGPQEAEYLENSRRYTPSLEFVPDDGLLEIGYAVCAVYDGRGVSAETLRGIIDLATQDGMTETEIRSVIASSATWLCSQHGDPVMRAFDDMVNKN